VEPASARAYTAQGYAFHRSRDFANAILAFENCLRAYPDHADAHHGLAQSLRETGAFVQALSSHDRAIELEPKRHDLYWERGVTCLRMNNADGAIADFQACLQRSADFAEADNALGIAYRNKEDFKQALLHHENAISLRPERSDFYRERGFTHQKQGDQQRAQEDFAKARELDQRK
jgi:tetratricopeptide (TPR) repeat protein